MGGVAIQVKGLDRIRKKIGSIPQNVITETEALMETVGRNYVDRAVQDAPKDEGTLIEGISYKQIGEMDFEIVSSAYQSVFLEFGTKRKFKPIAGIDASKYKVQSRGDYYDFLNNILDWVKRKGIGGPYKGSIGKLSNKKKDKLVEVAEAISFSIIRHGINPHPFFFKQLPLAQNELKKGMKEVVKKALDK